MQKIILFMLLFFTFLSQTFALNDIDRENITKINIDINTENVNGGEFYDIFTQ